MALVLSYLVISCFQFCSKVLFWLKSSYLLKNSLIIVYFKVTFECSHIIYNNIAVFSTTVLGSLLKFCRGFCLKGKAVPPPKQVKPAEDDDDSSKEDSSEEEVIIFRCFCDGVVACDVNLILFKIADSTHLVILFVLIF